MDEVVELEIILSKRVFAFYWRLFFDTSEKFKIFVSMRGQILEKYKLFTTPRILALCSIYSVDNKKICNILMVNIFMHCPSLYRDFEKVVEKITNNLNDILKNPKDSMEYLSDTMSTLLALFKVFPYASLAFNNLDFLVQVTLCYENVQITNNSIRSNMLELTDIIIQEAYLKIMFQDPVDKIKFTRDAFFEDRTANEAIKSLNDITHYVDFKNLDSAFVKLINSISNATRTIFGESEMNSQFLFDYDQKYGLESWLFNWQSSGIKLCNDEQCIPTLLKSFADISSKFATKEEKEKIEKLQNLQILFPECDSKFLFELYQYYEGNIEKVTNAMLETSFPQKFIQSMEKMPNLGINVSMPMTGDVSPTTWNNVNFFGGKKKQQVQLDVIDEELRNKILDTVSYDDEYDDSYDQYLTVQEKHPLYVEEYTGNPNRKPQVVETPVVTKDKKIVEKTTMLSRDKKPESGSKPVDLKKKSEKKKETDSPKDRRDKEQNKAKVGNHDRKHLRDKKTKLFVQTSQPQ